MSPRRPTHAYLGILNGICQAACLDFADEDTAEFVADVIRSGGYVERAPTNIAMQASGRPWPLVKERTAA